MILLVLKVPRYYRIAKAKLPGRLPACPSPFLGKRARALWGLEWGILEVPHVKWHPCFFLFWGVNFLIVLSWKKYDSNTCKWFLWKQGALISPYFELKHFWQIFTNMCVITQQVAKNIKLFLTYFLLSYLVFSQIWQNLLVDDHQCGYITKVKCKKPPHFCTKCKW
jgi:hypothetical protein